MLCLRERVIITLKSYSLRPIITEPFEKKNIVLNKLTHFTFQYNINYFFSIITSRDTRATVRVARRSRAKWSRLRRVSRLGCAWHSDFFLVHSENM